MNPLPQCSYTSQLMMALPIDHLNPIWVKQGKWAI